MKTAIIDADLIGRSRHRFPNLACMKISAYRKEHGDAVELKTDYKNLEQYDRVYISRVFTDTSVPDEALRMPNVIFGGTGFYYDKAEPLPPEIEHHFPNYHLYDDFVEDRIFRGGRTRDYGFFTDYSIGFLTRGCFRKCEFCVNKNYDRVSVHSPLSEFFDHTRPKICLLDDNFLGCPQWKELLSELQSVGKPFVFRQGLDIRLLNDEKCEILFKSVYDGDYIFAFDNIADYDLIEKKLKIVRKHTDKILKFYCFTGYDREGKWDGAFWRQDIFDMLTRIEILMNYRCLPYVMRYNRYKDSPYSGVYTQIARWCNQPAFFKKKSLREFALANGENSACFRTLAEFEKKFPEVSRYYDLKFGENM